jgi:hypothetical protein
MRIKDMRGTEEYAPLTSAGFGQKRKHQFFFD